MFRRKIGYGDGHEEGSGAARRVMVPLRSGRSIRTSVLSEIGLEGMLKQAGFDEFCERECKRYYADGVGRPSLAPGVYFRFMLIGFFEGLDSERGIAWRVPTR